MAASGKKDKKNKWKKVELTSVLGETRPVTAWADESEIDERDIQIAAARKSTLPTAPRSARGTDDERVPNFPPFVAYITNIPFELVEDDIIEFFGDLQIDNIRLPRNDATGKLKGYGYVDFTERQGLIDALGISDKSMKGRRIRIEVSENSDRDRGGFGRSDRMGRDRMGMGMGRDGYDDPERTMGDWRSGPRSEPAGEDRMRPSARSTYGGSGFRDGDREGGFGAPRESDNREGGWREGMGSGSGNSFGDRDRDSFRSRGFGERDGFGDRDRDRERGSRYGDREGYGDRSDRPRDSYGDRYGDRPRFGDRDRDRDEDRDRFPRRDDAPAAEAGEPRARPKLNLQPRTRPIENPLPPPEEVKKEEEKTEETPAPAPPVPRTSIFGAAKPVDTTAREREIEERLARERDRAPRREEREEQDKKDENVKSKDGNEHVDESQSNKKIEVAPPPKENAWSRRPRIDTNNGESNQNDDNDHRGTSPKTIESSSHDSRQDEDGSHSGSYGNSTEQSCGDGTQEDQKEAGECQYSTIGSKDKQDNREEEFSRGRDGGNNNDRYEPKGGRGSQGPTRGVSLGTASVGRAGAVGGGNKGKQHPDRPLRKDHSNEDQSRLPKFEDKPVPNFVASNKYAFLNEDDDHEDGD